jgi:hypothetical protein
MTIKGLAAFVVAATLVCCPVAAYSQAMPGCSMPVGCQMQNCPMMQHMAMQGSQHQTMASCCKSEPTNTSSSEAIPASENNKLGFTSIWTSITSEFQNFIALLSSKKIVFNEKESPGTSESLFEKNCDLRI